MDATTLSTVTQLIGSLGFPIVVAGWLLIKGSKDSQNMQNAINAQTQTMEKLAAAVDMLTRSQTK